MKARWSQAPMLVGLLGGLILTALPVHAANHDQLLQLLERRSCRSCRLQDADLVHADLRDAQLEQAQLQRANLSRAQLDGANLRGANLTFSSLLGASLRGADLRGALLEGADLRRADLTGALLDAEALDRSHWQGAIGVPADSSSYAAMHNAGVDAALAGQFPEAEEDFNKALLKQPAAAVTWLARGLIRVELGRLEAASEDLTYAAGLYERQGSPEVAGELRQAVIQLTQPRDSERPESGRGTGHGAGSALLQGMAGLVQALAPLAIKVFAPTPF